MTDAMRAREEAIRYINAYVAVNKSLDDKEKEALDMAIIALSQPEPCEDALESAYVHGYTAAESEYRDKLRKCEDAVSRQAAIGCLRSGQICGDFCRKAINELPFVTPKPRMGHWIHISENEYACSECGTIWTLLNTKPEEDNMNFCPNCGVKMDGGKK